MIDKLAEMVAESENIVFFGGAGVSTESGIKDYRSEDGIYNTVKEYNVPPEIILSADFFYEHPEIFYDFYRKFFITDAQPNKAHKALARLEEMGKLKAVITQNIDCLHQKAGSKNVIELHGKAKEFYCYRCGKAPDDEETFLTIKNGAVPVCSCCKSVLKPKVVLYGEQLFAGITEAAITAISEADMLIVGGTSLAVYPAASFIEYFGGRHIVIINKSRTVYDGDAELVIRESIGGVLGSVMEKIGQSV